MTLHFGYSTLNWPATYDIDELFDEIRGAGWSAVEIFAQPLNWLGTPDRLQEQLDRADLRVATFFGASLELPTDALQRTINKRRIDYAAALGATAYGILGGSRLRTRAPIADEYADLARCCEELAVYGADQGVVVSYHPHTGCTIETQEEIERLLDGSPNIKLCLDPSHIALVGEDPVSHLRRYRERTGYVHLKDWGQGAFAELGRGTLGIDFPAILRELEEQRFGGWVIVEQSRSDISPLQSAKNNAEYLRTRGYAL